MCCQTPFKTFGLLVSLAFLSGCIISVDSDKPKGSTPNPTTGLSNPMTVQEINNFIVVINTYRKTGASCGTEGVFGSQEPLVWSQKLAQAAQKHSDDQYKMNQMSHTGSDNSKPSDRLNREGYDWLAVRENIASGYFHGVDQLAEAWMNSDGHCANIMASNVTELGIAATRLDNGNGFWTLKLARPRE